MRTLLLCPVILVVAACKTYTVPQNEGAPTGVAAVVRQIKADLAKYQDYSAKTSTDKALPNACNGIVGFDIDNVKVSLTTQSDDTSTVKGSLALPVGPVTFGPGLGASREIKGTETMTFVLYPDVVATPTPVTAAGTEAIDSDQYPIAASLQRLRNGLLDASDAKPCMRLVPSPDATIGAPKDPGGTFAFGFAVINKGTSDSSLKFVIFSLGATTAAERQVGNTITVTFKARKGSETIR